VTNIKCVIAAGGLGTRLKNFRNSDTTKMLLEVNGIPMIIRQINQLIEWGLEEFVVITNPEFESITKDVVKTNFQDTKIDFVIQEKQEGISHALLQAEPFLKDNNSTVFVLGDNFFEFNPLARINFDIENFEKGSYIFTYEVDNPSDFGVAVLDSTGNPISIEEKPEIPKSNKAIVGLYIYDNTVIQKIKTLQPSERGEYEITDLNNLYIKESDCMNVEINGWWIDAGTPERIEELESKLT
tara:strand:+ start:3150 stop:3872 length:723 start_codon:yes stop_codon:yes gene_type:complete